MPSDLTAAAKRWRADEYPREPIVRLQRELDAAALADAMAAELDDTPLTAEHIAAQRIPENPDTDEQLALWLQRSSNGLWVLHHPNQWHCRTLGDLKTCLRLAGVQTKGA